MLCVIPVAIVRWVLVGIAFAVSGYFLVANVYPILASVRCSCHRIPRSILTHVQAKQKATRALVVVIAVLHAGIALTFKVLFFSYYIKQIGKDPLGDIHI